MSIKIQCPSCGERCGINERMAGRRTRCPHCDSELSIPSREQIEAAKRKKEASQRPRDILDSVEAVPWAAAIPVAAPVAAEPPESSADDGEDHGFEPLPIGNKANREETEMDMTPMVDVTFLLLIFFMVTASFALQKAVELPPQQSEAPSSNPKRRRF